MIKKQDIIERLKSLKLSHVITIVVFTIVFLGAIFGIIQYQSNRKNQVEPKVEVLYPIEGDVFDFETTVIEGKVEDANTVTINGEEVEFDNEGVFLKELNLAEGENTISVIAKTGNNEVEKSLVVSRIKPFDPAPVEPKKIEQKATKKVTNLSSSGPETLWIPEITALSLAGAGWYGSRKKLKKTQSK